MNLLRFAESVVAINTARYIIANSPLTLSICFNLPLSMVSSFDGQFTTEAEGRFLGVDVNTCTASVLYCAAYPFIKPRPLCSTGLTSSTFS